MASSLARHPTVRRNPASPVRVLIADDYPDVAESTALILSLAGWETKVAYDGEDAFEQASAWHPHVCVIDLGMPKLDGRELARRLRGLPLGKHLVLIAYTGWTAEAVRHGAASAGFDWCVRKPVEPEELLRVVETQLLIKAEALAATPPPSPVHIRPGS